MSELHLIYIFLFTERIQTLCVRGLNVEDVGLVEAVHLLQEDEGEDGVRAEAGIVRSETFPQREEALLPHHSNQHLLIMTQIIQSVPRI